ncbi:MAG: hypothetical protein JWP91_1198 [Fibrobacteres bacterium]|nr:hypothetical protein [Fibrobacterota bacterium]
METPSADLRFPLEFPCFGPSPQAVRAAVTGLIRALGKSNPDLRIGWVTDPSERTPVRGPGAGGTAGFTDAPGNAVALSAPSWNSDSWRAALADCDIALTEGRPKPGFPGILVLPDGASAPHHPHESASESDRGAADPNPPGIGGQTGPSGSALLACVASFANPKALPPDVPVFSPDRLNALAALIADHARAALSAVPLYGLVLGGGRSSRMRADKASLDYHGKPQTAHCLELLGAHCERSFLSCRADQAAQPGFAGHPQIHDGFLDMGPLSGILSALKAHRRAAFLVLACDLPFLDARSLEALVAGRDPFKIATAFAGPQNGLPEPLCAIYEPRCYPRALQLMGQGISCPRKVILNSSSRILPAPDFRALLNANDPEAYREARKSLAS